MQLIKINHYPRAVAFGFGGGGEAKRRAVRNLPVDLFAIRRFACVLLLHVDRYFRRDKTIGLC